MKRFEVTRMEIKALIEYILNDTTMYQSLVNPLILRCGLTNVVPLYKPEPRDPSCDTADDYELENWN